MTCTACLRALALVTVTVSGLCGATAIAEQSEPATPNAQADSKSDSQKKKNSDTQDNSTQSRQTPAQERYGLPRNPLPEGRVYIDLSKPLTLERAIRIGLQRQNSIAIARTQADASSARLIQSRSSYYPQVRPSLTYQSSKQPGGVIFVNGVPVSASTTTENRTDGVTASYTIFDTGSREANVGLSRRSAFAAEYNVANERQNVILNVTQDYYNVLRFQELVRVQELNVQLAQTTLNSIQAQVQVGNAAKSDVLQAQSDLANAQVSLLEAQNNYVVGQASLKNSMGVVSSQNLTLSQDRVPAPSPEPDKAGLEEYVNRAYFNRYDLKQQQEQINAQGYSVKLAQINAGLTVDATIAEGYLLDPNAGEQRTFLVSFAYPLFDGGFTRAAVRESKAQLEQQRRTLDELQQNVRLNLEQAYLTRELARQRAVAGQAAVQAGQTNYDAALEKQKNGLINIVDVINAQVQLVNAQVSLVQATYDFYIADAQLLRGIGVNDPVFVPRVPGAKPILATNAPTPPK